MVVTKATLKRGTKLRVLSAPSNRCMQEAQVRPPGVKSRVRHRVAGAVSVATRRPKGRSVIHGAPQTFHRCTARCTLRPVRTPSGSTGVPQKGETLPQRPKGDSASAKLASTTSTKPGEKTTRGTLQQQTRPCLTSMTRALLAPPQLLPLRGRHGGSSHGTQLLLGQRLSRLM